MLRRDLLVARRSGGTSAGGGGSGASAFRTPPNASIDSRRSRPTSNQSRPVSAGQPLSNVSINHHRNARPPKLSTLSTPSSRGTPSFSAGGFPSPSTPGVMDEAVRVAVRCRPPNAAEGERDDDVVVSMDPSKREIYLLDQENKPWRVDTPLWSCPSPALDGSQPLNQSAIYDRIGRPLLSHALDGYNSTLMAYGQTGSGKTYTMMGSNDGNEAEMGVIPRVCQDLFSELENRSFTAMSGETISWEVHVRFVEVYCERISDLLNDSAPVNLREEVTPKSATFALVGARRVKAENRHDLMQALNTGNRCRKTASTRLNERSSRSHAIFIIELTEMLSFTDPDTGLAVSAPSKSLNLRLVDLAGSERVSETGVRGQQLKEAKDINLSLFTLGQVIECLTDVKRRSIKPPYRDSVLTKILRDAFGGNSKTTMICTIAPCERSRQQTVQTLSYAAKARRVLNKPRVEEDPSAVELRRANEELLTLRRELAEAQRTGKQHAEIQEQLREANERLRREQLEARRRRDSMEQREAELAARLQALETQREEYETQMAQLESEAEAAKEQQKKREEELRRAHRLAEKDATKRLKDLQAQREESERALTEKEKELLDRQREVEEKMRAMEGESGKRVEELMQKQRDLEAELQEREKQAIAQERELRRKHRVAEEASRKLEEQGRAMEEEWAAQVKALEADARRREEELAQRSRDAQMRLRETEEEYHRKEEEMRRKWTDAEEQSRRLQAEMEGKQAEVDRRVLELKRQAQEREGELNDKLQRAEFELRRRERESQMHQEELQVLREAAARQSESNRFREKDIEEHHSFLAETLQKREDQLKKREAELQEQFDQVMAMEMQWEQQHAEKTVKLQSEHDHAVAALKRRELVVQNEEADLRRQLDEMGSKMRAQEMELRRKEMELLAQRNDFNAQTQRERQANLRSKEELQNALDRAEADNRVREERLERWEEDLKARRAAVEGAGAERLQSLQERETALAAAEDTVAAKCLELDQLSKQLQREAEEVRARAAAEEEAREREHRTAMASLQRKESDLKTRFSSMDSAEAAVISKSRAIDGRGQAVEVAMRALLQRELFSFANAEALNRNVLLAEEALEMRFIAKNQRVEAREVGKRAELDAAAGQAGEMEERLRAAVEESRAARTEAENAGVAAQQLSQQLTQREKEAVDLRVQLGTAVAATQFAEEGLRASQLAAEERHAALEASLEDAQAQLARANDRGAESDRRYAQLLMACQLLVSDFEERQRSLIEHHGAQEGTLMRMLEMADRKTLEKAKGVAQWRELYENRNRSSSSNDLLNSPPSEGSQRRSTVVANAHRMGTLDQLEEELRRREEALFEAETALQQRTGDFVAHERARLDEISRQEKKIKDYLLELEESDRAATKALQEREARLVEMGTRLREKEAYLSSTMRDRQRSIAAFGAEEASRIAVGREEQQREGAERILHLREDHELARRGVDGDADSLAHLLRRQEAGLTAEAEKLQRRVRQAEEDEARVKGRLAEEEACIKEYLIALEQEDMRRYELSAQGQAALKEADEKLAKAKQREQELREMARRLQTEARAAEEQSRLLEGKLKHQERKQAKLVEQRKADLARRREEADSVAAANEKTLLDLENNLRDILRKNSEAEQQIKSRDAALRRAQAYHDELARLLAERNRLLKQEHAHRMDGKKSATWLATDLLDANETLTKELQSLRQRFVVLLREDKVQCSQCEWGNSRLATKCLCCGNPDIAAVGEGCLIECCGLCTTPSFVFPFFFPPICS